MAERRMFTKKITESDAFLDMPLSAQALYFHINMAADDEGFVNNPKKIQRMIGASEDDLKLLIMKNFLIVYDTGVIVIKHWKMHNYIQKDRFHPTVYQEERQMLKVKENGAYTIDGNELYTECIQDVSNLDTEVRLGKDSIGKVKNYTSYNSCSEPLEKATEQAVIYIPLVDKTEFAVLQKDVDEWQATFPAVDVMGTLKRIRTWCIDNPTRKKTRRGVRRFINSWLGREQDRGGNKARNGMEEFKNEHR